MYKSWRYSPAPYHDFQIILQDEVITIKEWFDPGKNPNQYQFNLTDVEEKPVKSKLKQYMSSAIYDELVTLKHEQLGAGEGQ